MTARTAVGPGRMLGSGLRHRTRAARPTQVTAGVCVPATQSAALPEISCDEQEASRRRVLAGVRLPIAAVPTRVWLPPRPAAMRLDPGPLAAQLISLLGSSPLRGLHGAGRPPRPQCRAPPALCAGHSLPGSVQTAATWAPAALTPTPLPLGCRFLDFHREREGRP